MARRPVNRLFQTNEFRVLVLDQRRDEFNDHIAFFVKKHPNREMGRRVTFTREKSSLLKAAAADAKLELMNISESEDVNLGHEISKGFALNGALFEPDNHNDGSAAQEKISPGVSYQTTSLSHAKVSTNMFHLIPKEISLQILKYLNVKDLSQFIKTSRFSRALGYDNFLWKNICFRVWFKPEYILVQLEKSSGALRLWYNWNAHQRVLH